MILINESTRENPCVPKCECGGNVNIHTHRDYLEGFCLACGKSFAIKMGDFEGYSIWNCCSAPENGCGFDCKNKF